MNFDEQHKSLSNLYNGFISCRTLEFANLDFFSTMFNFKVKGVSKYQTRLGSIYTLLFITVISSSFIYYVNRLNDKTSPIIQYSNYTSDEDVDIDLAKEETHLIF